MPLLEVVQQVDLGRYAGTWYEIASFPQRFQRGCENTKAVYALRQDGTVEVMNSCFRNNRVDAIKGKAWVVDTATNAKLKVSFFWPFRGEYPLQTEIISGYWREQRKWMNPVMPRSSAG